MAIKKGTSLANSLTGTSFADQLFGLAGNDILNGLAGNDLLDGGTGTDRMSGGAGNDTYVVDRSTDRVIENAGQGTDTVRSSVSLTIGANVEHLILTGSGNTNGTLTSATNEIGNSLTGNNSANNLNGGLGHDVLSGGRGSDRLNGGNGNDTLLPGAGNGVADTIIGGEGFDTVDYRDALAGVVVNLSLFGGSLPGGAALNDLITGVESIVGSAFADQLTPGDAQNAYALGGAGNDKITGNPNAVYDRLRGDDGNDILIAVPNSTEDIMLQYDRGMDFVVGFGSLSDDHVLLDHEEFGFTLSGGTRSLLDVVEFEAAHFGGVVSSSFFSPTQRLLLDTYSHILWADKDGNGTAFDPVPVALFSVLTSPTAADIWLI